MENSSLYTKILEAQKSCLFVRADSTISGGGAKGHKYASKNSIFNGVRRAIHEAGLVVIMSVKTLEQIVRDTATKEGVAGQDMYVTMTLEWTLADSETGESIKVRSVATASDKLYNADTLPQQAQTTAVRNFYSDFFQIPIAENQNDAIPPAGEDQYKCIKELMGQLKESKTKPSAEEYGKLLGMTPGESRTKGDEYKQNWNNYWGRMTADLAELIIQELRVKLRAAKPGDIPGEDFFGPEGK